MNYFLKRVSDITSRYPDRIAAIDETRTMTYEMLDQESGRVYNALKSVKAYPELEDTLFPISDFFDMLHFNHLGSLLEQGEIENLTEKSEDLRIFDITPGLLYLLITDHPDDNKVDMFLYYSTNHYKKESMERFVKLILEEVKNGKREYEENKYVYIC